MKLLKPLALAFALLGASAAQAGISVYNDQAAFLSATGASSATGALPSLTGSRNVAHIGSVRFADVNGYGFWVGGLEAYQPSDWTTLLPGHEIAINHVENLDVVFDAPVFSAGFGFAEPGPQPPANGSSPYANNASYPYADSTFTVTLKAGASVVGAFSFNAPDETGSFVGVWSHLAFDRMDIRETAGGIEDDYFGEFYSGAVAMPVPEPGTWALLAAGLGLLAWRGRRLAA